MSNPHAVSFLAKCVHYWPFDGNTDDAIGGADMIGGAVIAGFETGKTGQCLSAGSRAYAALDAPITVDADTRMVLGGWFYFSGAFTNTSFVSVGYNFSNQNEALYLLAADPSGKWSVGSWAAPGDLYHVEDPNAAGQRYDFTVRVEDSRGQVATSPQAITIRATSGNLPGWYFVQATWDADVLRLNVNNDDVAATTPPRPAPRGAPILYCQVGNQFGSSNTPCKVEDLFFCDQPLTEAEVNYLWNGGLGRSIAQIQADAA